MSNKRRFQNYMNGGVELEFDFKGSLETINEQNMVIKISSSF